MGELFALINAAGWSCGMVFARRAQQRAQVGNLGGLYCSLLVNTVINLMMFLGGLLAQPLPPVTVRGMVFFVLGGVCNSLIGRGLLFYTVSLLGAARAGVVKATTPVFALLCGVFLLHEVIAPLDWLGIAAVLCGVLTIAIGGARRNQGGAAWDGTAVRGVLFGLLASLFLALGNLFRKLGVSAIPSSSVGVFVGSLSALSVLSVFLLITGPGILRQALRHLDRDYAVSGLSTSVALYFLFTSLQMIPLSIANSLTAAEPLFTLLLGRLLLGRQEKPTTALVAGALSTVLGAVLLACF